MKKTELQYKVGRIGRRRFLTAMTATGTVAATPLWGGVSPGNSSPTAPLLDPKALEGKPWKLDVTIYDRPGWTCTTYGLPVLKRENNELVVGFQAQREDTYTDDFYSAHAEWVFLSSKDGGKSWEPSPWNSWDSIRAGGSEVLTVVTPGRSACRTEL